MRTRQRKLTQSEHGSFLPHGAVGNEIELPRPRCNLAKPIALFREI